MSVIPKGVADWLSNAIELGDGRRDCINGVEHKEGRSAAYDRGYSEQYAIEQQQSERTK